MSPYELLDWAYLLPAGDRIPGDVLSGLDGWMSTLVKADAQGVVDILRKRYLGCEGPVAELSRHVLTGHYPMLVGGEGKAYVTLSWGVQREPEDYPWIPRDWMTPWKMDPDKTRQYLKSLKGGPTNEPVDGWDESLLAFRALQEWTAREVPQRGGATSGNLFAGEESIYISSPSDPEDIDKHLKRLGMNAGQVFVDFLKYHDGLREAEPRCAGGFIPISSCETLERLLETSLELRLDILSRNAKKEWGAAIAIFKSVGGDQLLLRPDGKLGWLVHEKGEIEVRYEEFADCLNHYVKMAFGKRWPFDPYEQGDGA